MLLRSCPRLLVLALSLPEVSHALGLGNLRVDSKLNEPLSAQIDILGATPDELKAMRASVASPELFQRYHAERPAFLSSATITVGTDAAGKPILNIKSSEAFTEPLLEFLVDVHWAKGELLRDYSLLLDPARSAPPVTASAAATANTALPAPLAEPLSEFPRIVLAPSARIALPSPTIVQAPGPAITKAEVEYRVVAHDTLRDIARRAGARSEIEQQRMMLAIFRANPQAFDGNINLVHSGALIRIPSTPEIEVFDSEDVERVIRAQMRAWRRNARPAYRLVSLPEPARSEKATVPAPALSAPSAKVSAAVSTVNILDDRVAFLQKTLSETNRQLALATVRLGEMERATSAVPAPARKAASVQVRSPKGTTSLSALLMALGLLGGAVVYSCRRWITGRAVPREPVRAEVPTIEMPLIEQTSESEAFIGARGHDGYTVAESMPEMTGAGARVQTGGPAVTGASDLEATLETTHVVDIDVNATQQRDPDDMDEPDTVVLATLESKATDAVGTPLDYNLSDLDGRSQHVEMPGSLHDHVVVVERRKNIVDSLLAAIKRDPTRNDLRMKLLETLYSTASKNLQAFKEVVRDLASHPESLKAGEWEQIVAMGRQIAADDALFAELPAERKLA